MQYAIECANILSVKGITVGKPATDTDRQTEKRGKQKMKTIKDITTAENNASNPKTSTLIFISNDDKIYKCVYRANIKKDTLTVDNENFLMTQAQKKIIQEWQAVNAQHQKLKKQQEGVKEVKCEKLNYDNLNAQIADNLSKITTLKAQLEKLQADTEKLQNIVNSGDIEKINAEREKIANEKNKIAQSKTPAMCTLFDMLVKANQATSRENAREKWIKDGEKAFDENIYNALYTVVKMQYNIKD